MELKEGASVYSANGEEIGKINRFVIHPGTKEISHIVVEKGWLFPEDKVIPINWVISAETDRVTLSQHSSEVNDLPPFEEMHYIRLDDNERGQFSNATYAYIPLYYWYPPLGAPAYSYTLNQPNVAQQLEQNIPDSAVALEEGADVISADGKHIGDVERLFADPDTNRATHFLISKGLLLKERKMVPVDWITLILEDKVHLAVGENFVEHLPDYQS